MIKEMRDFPSVEELISDNNLSECISLIPQPIATDIVKQTVAKAKKEFQETDKPLEKETLISMIRSEINKLASRRLRRVINATGTINHTNLGRAPISRVLLESVSETVCGYGNLEFDVSTGRRGKRGEECERYLAQLSGAESATVVNNCAAALFIIVNSFANRKQVIISRGELVQIGGGFRIQDILKRSGGKLCEIGSSNITTVADYEEALSDASAIILKVHRSNFSQSGFTSDVGIKDLMSLSGRGNTIVVNDLGSGSFVSTRKYIGYDEPTVQQSVRAGADLTCFSGDKLLGGTQAGLIVGRSDLIKKIKKNPLFRALRADKLLFATFEQLFMSYLSGRHEQDIPLWRILAIPESELYKRGKALYKSLGEPPILSVVGCGAFVGGGAAPGAKVPSVALRFSDELSSNKLSRLFRECEIPIIGRIEDDCFLIDLRAVEINDLEYLVNAITLVLAGINGKSKR